MKIRLGFVSNSSSSSFCIYGAKIDLEVIYDMIKTVDEEDIDCWEMSEIIEEFIIKNQLDLNIKGTEDVGYYIGKEWSNIKDDQTGKEFKESIESNVKKLTQNNDIKCGTYSEAWYDG